MPWTYQPRDSRTSLLALLGWMRQTSGRATRVTHGPTGLSWMVLSTIGGTTGKSCRWNPQDSWLQGSLKPRQVRFPGNPWKSTGFTGTLSSKVSGLKPTQWLKFSGRHRKIEIWVSTSNETSAPVITDSNGINNRQQLMSDQSTHQLYI